MTDLPTHQVTVTPIQLVPILDVVLLPSRLPPSKIMLSCPRLEIDLYRPPVLQLRLRIIPTQAPTTHLDMGHHLLPIDLPSTLKCAHRRLFPLNLMLVPLLCTTPPPLDYLDRDGPPPPRVITHQVDPTFYRI